MKKINYTQLIKYILKPQRIIDAYHYIKENKKNNCIIRMGSCTSGSTIDNDCIIGTNNTIINSIIGRRTRVKTNCHIYDSHIGAFCAFAENVTLGAGNHPTHFASTNAIFYSKNKTYQTFADKEYFMGEHDEIIIENDVWLGANSSIIGNVKVGSGAIIAYGAVVTKDVPPYAIVGGIPAKIIKMRFNDDIINKLLEIQWWNLSDLFLQKHFKLFHNPNDLISFYENNKDYVEGFRMYHY